MSPRAATTNSPLRWASSGVPAGRTRVEDVDVRAIRSKLGLSQAEFSRRYALSPRSLQEWEQGRRRPESAVRAYLTVIDKNPEAVEEALMNKS